MTINRLNKRATNIYEQLKRLRAENKQFKKRYIEAVNDMAYLKRKAKKTVCPHCGFGFGALKEK